MADIEDEAERLGVSPPSISTLRRYGITALDWLRLLRDQGWVCAVCLRRVPNFVTDHEHFPRWKHMPPQERARYVRGVLCAHCNWRKVHSNLSAVEARRIAEYFEAYERRRDN